jgi:hypothetical protein
MKRPGLSQERDHEHSRRSESGLGTRPPGTAWLALDARRSGMVDSVHDDSETAGLSPTESHPFFALVVATAQANAGALGLHQNSHIRDRPGLQPAYDRHV